ncbi:MAG: hypothetical protein COV44_04800 [Deltaproteobacteria bacterium CG11_big_fil_rev_8_21_14_0_20_45_16]|nr:MAG: hypothetical protein COV44_04800 [Deltaproteobacteria bacterium CG11_big_fil_rev_8_21_14_0_20_45_16]
MFGMGWGEILVIGIIAMILIGPKQLPGVVKQVAKLVKELSKAREEWMQAIRSDKSVQEIQRSFNEINESARDPMKMTREEVEREAKKLSDAIEKAVEEKTISETTEVYAKHESPEVTTGKIRKNPNKPEDEA